jgi:hypothetical protein
MLKCALPSFRSCDFELDSIPLNQRSASLVFGEVMDNRYQIGQYDRARAPAPAAPMASYAAQAHHSKAASEER